MASLEQIINYFKRYAGQYPVEALRAQLLKQGVPAPLIEQALIALKSGTSPLPARPTPTTPPTSGAPAITQPLGQVTPAPKAGAAPAEAPAGYKPPTAPPFQPPPGRAYVLVVDDDDMMRNLITERLEGAGYRVASAADAAQSVIQAEGMKLALILSDVQMPGFGTGVDALRKLRASSAVPSNLPVIFITGLVPEQAARIIPQDDPYVRVVYKPIDWKLLSLYIRDLTGMDRKF